MHRSVDALVIGGGLAGAYVAALLAQAGRSVEVMERTSGPHDKVCGEFLSSEAVSYLHLLDIDLRALGAVPITKVRVAARKVLGECPLPFQAMSLTRKVLDEAVLQRAEQMGATVLRGRRVESLAATSSGWVARLHGASARIGESAFLATGKHDLHGTSARAGKQNDLVAFKMYFRLAPEQQAALSGTVELILFAGGYGGLQLVEGGEANLCVLVQRQVLRGLGASWAGLLEHMTAASPHLAKRLAGSTPLLAKPLALSSIPYGHLPRVSTDGLWRLGDQAAVIPSFTGCGMSLALHTAYGAAQAHFQGQGAAVFAERLDHHAYRPVHIATFLSQLMIASPVLVEAVRWWPQILDLIARHTRVPLDSSLTLASPSTILHRNEEHE